MTDYAAPITAPRPRTRRIDAFLDWISRASPFLIVLMIGFVFGIGQGYLQCERAWQTKVIERSQVDPSGLALPVYEDSQGNVYYTTKQTRP